MNLIRTFVVMQVAALLMMTVQCAPAPRDTVVLIILDTVRADALSCYGNPSSTTPRIDAVAAQGVRFEHAISASGWTLPAVASIFTGAWPTVHGGLGKTTTLTPIRDELPTAAEVLKQAGFATLGIANAAFVSPMLKLDRGFDVFDHKYTYNWDARRADETIDAAIDLLRASKGKSTFLMIHLFDPHLDYDPPGSYKTMFTAGRTEPAPPLTDGMCREMAGGDGDAPPTPEDIAYVRAVYHGEVAFMDEHVGRLIDALVSFELYDDATVIITSDHGEEFWDHNGFEHGHTLYDELIRVPLIVKFPLSVQPVKAVVEDQVRTVDAMSTVFDVYDIAQPGSFEGRSLLPLAQGKPDEPRVAFSESTLYGRRMISWRVGDYKFIYDAEDNHGELYDCRKDPHERIDILKDRPDVARKLSTELLTFYRGVLDRAGGMSKPEPVNLSPSRIKQLRSLGYIR